MITSSGHVLGTAGRHIIAVLTEDYSILSNAYQPSRPKVDNQQTTTKSSKMEKFVSGNDLDTPINPFQSCLNIYKDKQISTFSILI